MANLKEIRSRITSINSTMQITSAMKMVSAAKSKKAQDAIAAMKPYAQSLGTLLGSLKSALGTDSPYLAREREERVLLVAITSDRGLCGGFNSAVIKRCLSLMETTYKDKTVSLVTLGKKGNDLLRKTGQVERYEEGFFDHLSYAKVADLASELMEYYTSGKYDRIELIYNSFKNVATQILTQEVFLPLTLSAAEDTVTDTEFLYEPSSEEIVASLIPKSLKLQLYKAVRDSLAAEHGARMTAMHKATDNATELRDQLKLTYNKARQTTITNEILEIVSGANALG